MRLVPLASRLRGRPERAQPGSDLAAASAAAHLQPQAVDAGVTALVRPTCRMVVRVREIPLERTLSRLGAWSQATQIKTKQAVIRVGNGHKEDRSQKR
jgi:hypothetical protein